MRILTIELQNINSLKSDKPFVIDFTDDRFTNVGLYAITGSTGAGKTTVLDAITVALYNKIPRFNPSNVKAGLVDVVSHGASEAHARVVFENNNETFEAHWGMRIKTKAGKLLSKPQEEVGLKNLTTGQILASSKKDVLQQVERVTQLTYKQFLRSVLLAQGEFASFLSAKSSEKGALLEQITGDEIYKKIGEATNKRLNEERRILENLQAKINHEDILSVETRADLEAEKTEKEKHLKTLSAEIENFEKQAAWYTKQNTLETELKQHETAFEELQKRKEEQKPILEKLKTHEDAAPFETVLRTINRLDKEIAQEQNAVLTLAEELRTIDATVKNKLETQKQNQLAFTESDNYFKSWLPKLEQVSNLDSSIAHQKAQNAEAQNAKTELEEKRKTTSEHLEKIQKKKILLSQTLVQLNDFLDKNSDIPKIENHFNSWSFTLKTLQNDTLKLAEEKKNVSAKTSELSKTNKLLKEKSEEYAQLKNSKEEKEKQLAEIANQLGRQDLKALLNQKDDFENRKNLWNNLKIYAEEFAKLSQKKSALAARMEENNRAIVQLTKNRDALELDIQTKKASVNDADKIVQLELAIKGFEEERQRLVKGEPCKLCGSKHHPFVEEYEVLDVSKSTKILEQRKKELEVTQNEQAHVDQQIAACKANAKGFRDSMQELISDIETLEKNAAKLNLPCEITATEAIEKNIAAVVAHSKKNQVEIDGAQKLQIAKDNLIKLREEIDAQFNLLQQNIATLTEKKTNLSKEIETNENAIGQMELAINQKTEEMKSAFLPFQISIPALAETTIFLEHLTEKINEYNAKVDAQKATTNNIKQLETEIDFKNNAQIDLEKNLEKVKNSISEINENLVKLQNERHQILPENISVNGQRERLIKAKELAQQNLDAIVAEVNVLENKTTEIATSIAAHTKNADEKIKERIVENSELELRLKTSPFSSTLEIESALLSAEQKLAFSEIRNQMVENELRLKTLNENTQREINAHQKLKTCNQSKEIIDENILTLNENKTVFTERLGEIREKFKKDDEIKSRNASIVKHIENQRLVLRKWTDLMGLLGGSKDSFNTYVQRLTLQHLIAFANIHLAKLNKRYSLKMNANYSKGDELSFELVDHYQTDETRYVDTSSGGEKFLISLALALGLSDLASNNVRIDSLFIDEGFGTLDSNTLETVISALENLQSQGKKIGIISHVENLKERIPTQIQINKMSSGVSSMEIV